MAKISGFEQDCQTAIGVLRAALMGLYAAVEAPTDQPQEVSRAFKLNKNLTWKISKLMTTADAADALQYLPGVSGMKIFLRAMESAGAASGLLSEVRDAYAQLEQTVQVHVGDRSTLELVLDGLGPARSERLEVSRKLAFRGMSGVWGVQARAKLTIALIKPSDEDGSMLELAFARGFVGFRRLRSELSWPISVRRDWVGEGEPVDQVWEPLEPGEAVNGLPILRDYTTHPMPAFELRRVPDGVCYTLPPGPVGNTAALDCLFSDVLRAGTPRYRSESDRHGEIVSGITVPVEHQLTDIIYHRGFADPLEAEALIYGDPFGNQRMISGDPSQYRLPISERVVDLPGAPPIVATPLFAGYPRLLTRIFDRLGWEPREFRGVRLQTRYPPMGTNVSVRFDLPERP
ncbi:MAG: hypothetical protein K8E66_09340 [Phycisphaerales bacterium]|nr:hypothetical protein [Phycisphaerales bacterium]